MGNGIFKWHNSVILQCTAHPQNPIPLQRLIEVTTAIINIVFSSGQLPDILLYLIVFDLENQKKSLIWTLIHMPPVKARDIPKQ